jgi:hypothetical protein
VTEHLYIATRDGLVKVGMAVNLARRIRQQRAELLWSVALEYGAGWIEYAACRAMKRRVVPGKREWFTVRPEVALRIVRAVMRRSMHMRAGHDVPHVAEAIGVSKSLIYQRARGEWAPRIAEGAGGK